MADKPFGGGGAAAPMDAATAATENELLNMLNTAGKQKYMVDLGGGTKLEISFDTAGVCTMKSGETVMTFGYKKI